MFADLLVFRIISKGEHDHAVSRILKLHKDDKVITGYSTYEVKPGDKLWKIGKGQDVPFIDIASDNNISPPFTIYPGQKLQIRQYPPAVKHLVPYNP